MNKDLIISGFKKIFEEQALTDMELSQIKDYIRSGFFIDITDNEMELIEHATSENIRNIINEIIIDNVRFQLNLRYGV